METINNVASAASKAIWGESNTTANETAGQEPLSGEQGKGTATEPYDQGNKDNPTAVSSASKPTTSSTSETTTSSSKPPTNPSNAANAGPPRPEHETDKTGVVGNMSKDRAAADINPSSASDNPGAAPSSGAAPTHKQQGADKPKATPSGEEADAVKSKKDAGEEALKKKDPNDHSGEPLKVHDGSEKERSESKAGQEGGGEQGKEKGTGEEYVKTTGVHADGGDFDATKPGAGREADRLLEQKGVDRSAPNQPGSSTSNTGDDHKASKDSKDSKDKPSVGQKIKDKLHIGSKDK